MKSISTMILHQELLKHLNGSCFNPTPLPEINHPQGPPSSLFLLDAIKVSAGSHAWFESIMSSAAIRICSQDHWPIGGVRKNSKAGLSVITCAGAGRLTRSIWSLRFGGVCILFCVRWSETAPGLGFRGFVRLLKNVPAHFSSWSLLTVH